MREWRAGCVGGRKVEKAAGGVNLLLCCVGLLLSLGCSAKAGPVPASVPRADWPMLLGNTRRAGYELEATPDSARTVWERSVGRGLSMPVIANGPVLFSGTANRSIVALSTDGAQYWIQRLDGAVTGGVVHGGTMVFANAEERGKAYALDRSTGRRVWSRAVGAAPNSPLLSGDTVYYATDTGAVVALNARTGGVIWRSELAGAARTPPTPYEDGLVVATASDTAYMLARSNGQIRARAALPAGASGAPAIFGDRLYQPLHSGTLLVLALPALIERERHDLGAPLLGSPVIDTGGIVYQLTSAAEVWRLSPRADRIAALGGAARASLTLARDRLLVGRLDGTLFLLRLDGSEVWRTRLGGGIHAPASVQNGAVYVPLLTGTVVKLQ